MNFFRRFIEWVRRLFLRKDMELCMIGLSGAGKTSLVNLLATGDFKENVIPTVGFNMRKVQRGGITMKVWDLGGQRRFRGMWERYCRGTEAIVFMVDSSDPSTFAEAATEIRLLMQKPSIENVPVLLIGNKIDNKGAVPKEQLMSALNLATYKANREMAIFLMSCKTKENFGEVVDWLLAHSR